MDPEKCTKCLHCVAVCPVKMCNNVLGDYVELDPQLCIGCGSCIKACSQGARTGIDDADAFFNDVKRGTPIVAIVAPATIVSFKGMDLQLNGWLKSLGVKAVFDVSFGAELTTKSYIEYIKRNNPDCIISQPCAPIVTFCEIYRPELLKLLAPTDSPMQDTMRMIKRFYPKYANCKIMVVSPCYAKRREFDETGMGDYNVTIVSIENYFKENRVNLGSFPKVPYENPLAERGVLYSCPGGLMRTAERFMPGIREYTRKIEGSIKVTEYLAGFTKANGSKKPIYKLIDCLNCENGCNEGAGTSNHGMHLDVMDTYVETRRRARCKEWKTDTENPKAVKKLNAEVEKFWKPGLYDRKYVDHSAYFHNKVKEPSQSEITQIFAKMHKQGKDDVLDCGACGYNTCEQMAVAIYNNLNKPENCVHYTQYMLRTEQSQREQDIQDSIDDVVNTSAQKLGENKENVDSLVAISHSMIESVSTSSSAVEQMIANINSINSVLEQNSQSIAALDEATVKGKSNIETVVKLVSDIESSSASLAEMSKVIQNIADQTNLLAMNAAIEATHAGNYGKGFAVVAGEIRKLAEDSAKQAGQISQVLEKIMTIISNTYKSTGDTKSGFDKIVQLSQTVVEQEGTVKNAVAEQTEGGKLVLDAVEQMKAHANTVNAESEKLKQNTELVMKAIEDLKNR